MDARCVCGRPRVRRGLGAHLRAADEVAVLAKNIGFVTVSKATARRLLREKGDRVTAEFVPALGLLLIAPTDL